MSLDVVSVDEKFNITKLFKVFKLSKTVTIDVYRKHTCGIEYFEPITVSLNEVMAFERGSFDWMGDRLTRILIKNDSYPNPTEFEALMSYEEAKDLFGDKYEKIKLT